MNKLQVSIIAALALAFLSPAPAYGDVKAAAAERLDDGRIELTWRAEGREPVDVIGVESSSADLSSGKVLVRGERDGEYVVPADAGYNYFVLKPKDGPERRVAHRLLPLEGALNFRDVGGYKTVDGREVKWGRIFRSADLSTMTDADYARMDHVGIRTVYDLRSVEERIAQPTDWRAAPMEHISHSYRLNVDEMIAAFKRANENGDFMAAMEQMTNQMSYPSMLNDFAPQFRAVFDELLAGETPILYHCAGGTDRTGVTTALILAALGVPRETIKADYELSQKYFTEIAMRNGQVLDGPFKEIMEAMMSLPPEELARMQSGMKDQLNAFFEAIDDEYGGVEGYLERRLNVTSDDIARLRQLYTQ